MGHRTFDVGKEKAKINIFLKRARGCGARLQVTTDPCSALYLCVLFVVSCFVVVVVMALSGSMALKAQFGKYLFFVD